MAFVKLESALSQIPDTSAEATIQRRQDYDWEASAAAAGPDSLEKGRHPVARRK